MTLKVAAKAGYCFGVRRAVEAAESAAPAYTYGSLINNPQAVALLEKKGVVPRDGISGIPDGARVIIRSHGIGKREKDELLSKGCSLVDATCPFVRRIHEMAETAAAEGRMTVVIGESEHPEVKGILGWALEGSVALETSDEASELPDGFSDALVVAQTTQRMEVFGEVAGAIKRRFPGAEIRDTVCTATRERRDEAAALAKESDVMLVIGAVESSNSRKLYELCKGICERTYFIQDARQTASLAVNGGDIIGITAGASTPDCIIMEVVTQMNDIENKVTQPEELQEKPEEIQEQPEELQEQPEATTTDSDFMADVEKTLVRIRPGQTIVGTVVQITDDEVCVNVGYKADGLIKKADLVSTDVKLGDEIEVEVVKVNDGEGNVLLSQKNLINKKNWEEIVEKFENGEFVTGTGKSAVKGGLLADVMGIRTFVPASQLSGRFLDNDKIKEQFEGKEMTLKIIEVNSAKKSIVASRRAVVEFENEQKKKEIWDSLEGKVGEIVKGTVRRLADFGAFVDVGGVDGLVHITDLSYDHIKHPSEAVAPNDVIDVKIIKVDRERERISLSAKQAKPNPWDVVNENYTVGSIVDGKVVRLASFGAFVKLEPGLDGLVYISQISPTRIEKVEDAVQVGQDVRVKITDIDTERRRISLSIRQALEDEAIDDGVEADDYAIGGDDETAPAEAEEAAEAVEETAEAVEETAEAVEETAEAVEETAEASEETTEE